MSVVTQAVQAYYRKAREPKYDPAELRLSDTGAVPDPFLVHYDPAHGAEIESDLRELRALIDAGTAPEIPDWMQAGQFPCSWTSRSGGGHCQYFGHCWGKG